MHNVYHLHCFKCDECGRTLEKGDEFGLKDRRLFCKDDLDGIKHEKESFSDSTIGELTHTLVYISLIRINELKYSNVNNYEILLYTNSTNQFKVYPFYYWGLT